MRANGEVFLLPTCDSHNGVLGDLAVSSACMMLTILESVCAAIRMFPGPTHCCDCPAIACPAAFLYQKPVPISICLLRVQTMEGLRPLDGLFQKAKQGQQQSFYLEEMYLSLGAT